MAHKFNGNENKWKMCHKSLWSIGDQSHIPIVSIGRKSIMSCNRQYKCYLLNSKKSNFIRAQMEQDGIQIPFNGLLYSQIREMATAGNNKYYFQCTKNYA